MTRLPENIQDLHILHYPDPRLRQVARPLAFPLDPRIGELVEWMRVLLKQDDGVGLAATQIGLPIRLFLANPTRQPGDEIVVLNGEFIETEGWQDTQEGCLSVPGVQCKLRRHQRVKLRFNGLDGQRHELDASGLLATILQHETDHLDGRLIIDRLGLLAKLSVRDPLKRLEEDFEATQSLAAHK